MSRIVWDNPEDLKFEAGVEKGVLYVGARNSFQYGFPWNGLVSVNDSYVDGDVEPRYQDGIKTYNRTQQLEFETELTAYTYPDEFEPCIGISEVSSGMYIDEQYRQEFNLTYQTKTGDKYSGGYSGSKIHFVYNAVAVPNAVTRNTIGEISELTLFSWGLKTRPLEVRGHLPTSHFILDPKRMGPRLYEHIHDLLYGTPSLRPRLLYPQEIIDIAGDWNVLYPSPTTYPSENTIAGAP